MDVKSVDMAVIQKHLAELRSVEWDRAAAFYSNSPDGQWDKEARFACGAMPMLLGLLEEMIGGA